MVYWQRWSVYLSEQPPVGTAICAADRAYGSEFAGRVEICGRVKRYEVVQSFCSK